MPILDHFELIAPFYEKFIHFREPEKIIRRLGLPIKGTLLDAGGGTGRVSESLNGLAGHIIVADLSAGMLQQAKQKNGLQVVNSHTETLPFLDHSFDRIVMVDALHHVCDQQESANEMLRVLKPGGKILIVEPDVRMFSIKLVAIAEKLALMRSHFLSPPKIEALFTSATNRVWTEIEEYNAYVMIEKMAV